jgi:hypothetical protein
MTAKKDIKHILNPLKNRSPIQHIHAADYLLVTLLSFALSVGGTRLFLDLTGYPQIRWGEYHIAHVLWGGLLLFIAALIPVIFINSGVLPLSAALTGVGIGLFIDEVGKFITTANDYHFPLAAPIVYIIFLLTAVLFSRVRRSRPQSVRSKMYGNLELFNEVLDHDLSKDEYDELVYRLTDVIQSEKDPGLVHLALDLKDYLEQNRISIVPEDPDILEKIRLGVQKFEKHFLTKKRLRIFIVAGLIIWSAWAILSPIGYFLMIKDAGHAKAFLDQLMTNNLVRNPSGLNWFEARVIIEDGSGVIALCAATMILFNKDKPGAWLGKIGLLVTLTIVDLIIFYFDQFSTIILVGYHFILLILVISFQRRFQK